MGNLFKISSSLITSLCSLTKGLDLDLKASFVSLNTVKKEKRKKEKTLGMSLCNSRGNVFYFQVIKVSGI